MREDRGEIVGDICHLAVGVGREALQSSHRPLLLRGRAAARERHERLDAARLGDRHLVARGDAGDIMEMQGRSEGEQGRCMGDPDLVGGVDGEAPQCTGAKLLLRVRAAGRELRRAQASSGEIRRYQARSG